MWENKEFRIKLQDNLIYDYEKVMLSSGQCDFFMTMGFVGDEEGETACYYCSGFAPLSGYRIERTEDALFLLERTLVILRNSIEYLISPTRVTLTTNTVFYNKDTGQVKIAYIPQDNPNMNLRKSLVSLIGELKADLSDGHEELLDEIARCIYYKNYFIKDIINRVAIVKRELYASGLKILN